MLDPVQLYIGDRISNLKKKMSRPGFLVQYDAFLPQKAFQFNLQKASTPIASKQCSTVNFLENFIK